EYVVEPGQTLSQISAAFGVPVQTIMADNGIKDAAKIRSGQTLWIQAKK
ncbi:MAG: LysM peptidoglycan-binding domain-containing protein, partial [Kiritimatiellae bacterium]|nr:LysM peptidoglycan-binding domain-containing protein [Kiritimatiellia bacterium]